LQAVTARIALGLHGGFPLGGYHHFNDAHLHVLQLGDFAFKTTDGALDLFNKSKGSFEPCHPPRQPHPLGFQAMALLLNAALQVVIG
jgi:hypothetical protein